MICFIKQCHPILVQILHVWSYYYYCCDRLVILVQRTDDYAQCSLQKQCHILFPSGISVNQLFKLRFAYIAQKGCPARITPFITLVSSQWDDWSTTDNTISGHLLSPAVLNNTHEPSQSTSNSKAPFTRRILMRNLIRNYLSLTKAMAAITVAIKSISKLILIHSK